MSRRAQVREAEPAARVRERRSGPRGMCPARTSSYASGAPDDAAGSGRGGCGDRPRSASASRSAPSAPRTTCAPTPTIWTRRRAARPSTRLVDEQRHVATADRVQRRPRCENGSRLSAKSWLPSTTYGGRSRASSARAARSPRRPRHEIARDADEVGLGARAPSRPPRRTATRAARRKRRGGSRRGARSAARRAPAAARAARTSSTSQPQPAGLEPALGRASPGDGAGRPSERRRSQVRRRASRARARPRRRGA